LKIAVCIKQVPASTDIKVDPITGVLIRDGAKSKMNPYDLYAIETAQYIKESFKNVTIVAITMGPNQAKDVLKEAIWMGCDEAVLLSDRKFAGADVLATSRTLSEGIKQLGHIDLIICGKQTTDGDTAQVGPEMAEFLSIPQATFVNEIIEIKDKSITVSSNYENRYEILELTLPCLITIDKDIFTPRLPSYKRGVKYQDYEIQTIELKDLSIKDEMMYGLNGSPTQVERIFSPEKNTDQKVIEGSSPEVTQALYKKLKDSKFIE